MAEQRFTEQLKFSGGKVDRSGPYPIIRDVLFCGPTSGNVRDYLPEAFPATAKLYEGKPVFVDHALDPRARKFQEKIGWVENEQRREDGMPVGDIGVNPKHPLAEMLLFAAEHKPDYCGLSHDAFGASRVVRNREQVYKLRRVESLDIVIDPATTNGLLRESKGNAMTIQKLLEQIAAKSSVEQITKLRRLQEMDGMADLAMPTPAADVTPDDAIDQAFESAMHSQVSAFIKGEIDFKTMVSKLKELGKAHGKVTGTEVEEETKTEDEKKQEQKKKGEVDGVALMEALDVAHKIGFKADKTDLSIIAAQPVTLRESVAKRLMSASSTPGPKSTPRGAGTPLKESKSANQSDEPTASWLD